MRAEVRLRVPNMKDRAKDAQGYPIDHSVMRFRKIIEIPGIPHAGDQLQLTTRAGRILPASVMRVELDEERQLFILSCQVRPAACLARGLRGADERSGLGAQAPARLARVQDRVVAANLQVRRRQPAAVRSG